MRRLWVSITALTGMALAAWGGYRLWPRTIPIRPIAIMPVWEQLGERDIVKMPERFLVAELGLYDDELFAYLMFQYLRGAKTLKQAEVLLTYRRSADALTYAIEARLENDLIASLPLLAKARTVGLAKQYGWRYVNEDTLGKLRYQTQVFVTAYNLAAPHQIEDMNRSELAAYLKRFVRFKSVVDPRIRRQIEPIPHSLTNDEAERLAIDIVTVADFFSLPLEFFVGIGAMENNYMNVRGDLEHTYWKRRAEPGDVVLKHRRRRVLVLNSAVGVWQITRETLRQVHKLYLEDKRDYSLLPEHLRPPRELNIDDPDPNVLTTYAGLFFRQLLDEFNGDVSKAVGAYNGGRRNPNPQYEEGVRVVAEQARRIMQQAAVLRGQPAAGMRFWRPAGDEISSRRVASEVVRE